MQNFERKTKGIMVFLKKVALRVSRFSVSLAWVIFSLSHYIDWGFLWSAFVKATTNFCQSHSYYLRRSLKGKYCIKIGETDRQNVGLMCHSVKKIWWVKKPHGPRYNMTWKFLISSHQFMSSSALFVPFQEKNDLHFINTWLSNWKVFFEILRNDCLDVYDQ